MATQDAKLLRLLDCPALRQSQKAALIFLFRYDSIRSSGRLRLRGGGYERPLPPLTTAGVRR